MKSLQTSLFFAAVLVVLIGSGSARAGNNLVVNGGFEASEDTDGRWPSSYGDWHGDYSSIVGTTSGITPYEGSSMLQFKGSSWGSGASSAGSCQVPQIVNVSEFASLIASGNAVLSASTYFNRVSGDAQTDTQVGISVFAHEGSPSSYPSDRPADRWLLGKDSFFYTDGDQSTWEVCELDMVLPTNTDYVVIDIHTWENIYNDHSGVEFDGHFADCVSLTIGPLAELAGLEIEGPDAVAEDFQTQYRAIAYFDNNSTADITALAEWSVEPNTAANIDENGVLTTKDIVKDQSVTILASYIEGDVTVEAEKAIDILAICPIGTALQFDGQDDYVEILDSPDFTTSKITVLAWVKGPAQSVGRILSHYEYGTYERAWTMYSKDGTDKFNVAITDTGEYYFGHRKQYKTSVAAFDNSWHFLAFTFDGTGSNLKLYVDGTEDTDVVKVYDDPITKIHDSTASVTVGCDFYYGETDHLFNGKIDEVRIYNRALSAEEIRANMHTRLAGDEPNLVGYWDFDEGEGQIVYDLSGNGNDGQLGSTPDVDVSDPAWVESDAPIGICNPYLTATMAVERALERKTAMLEELLASLAKEWTAYEALEEWLENGDYGDLNKGDIVTAKQKIHSAMRNEEQAIDALEKSIEKLKDALSALGYELEER